METLPKATGPITSPPPGDWRARARAAGIDPGEVGMVADRYRAYRDYMDPRGGGLSLEAWFRFYRLEKQSELPDQTGGVVSGCSATGEAVEQTVLTRPGEFLALLKDSL
ncbi:MAG: hypothetical protein J0M16_12370 [Gammaproteobacteria bacterium]|nr:hypothetical protein [Gammaproteobacteria bacterium]